VEEVETEPYEDQDVVHLEEAFMSATLSTCPVLAFEPEVTPEMRIWCSVLITAVSDLGKKSYRDSALEWIKDSDSSDIGSFNWCCELFRLAPDRTRRYLISDYEPRWLSVRKG
jgi:hypothetical protein